MPTVPAYSGPQVAPEAPRNLMNTVQASPNAFGAAQGKALQGLGNEISGAAGDIAQAGERLKQRQDTNAVMDAENQLTTIEQARLNDPNTGYYATRGMQAEGGTQRILDDYTLQADTIRRGLKNPTQQAAFDRIFNSRKNAIGDAAARHEIAQTRQATLDNSAAMVKNSMNSAVDNYTDGNAISFNLVNGTRAIMTAAALNGQGQEETANQIAAFVSQTHTGVINRMMVDSPSAAEAYYKEHGDQIDGSTKGQIERDLKSNVDKDAARSSAESIYATGGSLADMLSEARKIENTDVSDQAISRIKTMYEEEEKSKTQAEEKIWSSIVNNPSYDAIPANLDGTTQKQMRDYVTERLTKGVVTTDPTTYRDLIEMAANSPDDFLTISLPTLDNKLDTSSMNYLKSLQEDVRKDGGNGVAGIRSQQEMVKGQMQGLGWDKDDKRGQQFFTRAQQEVQQFQKENNRQPKPDEFQQILDRLSIVTSDGWFKDSYLMDLKVDGVPPEYVDDIATSLQKKGKPLSPTNIRQTYLLAKQKGLLDAPTTNSGPANPARSTPGAPGKPVGVAPGVSDTLVNAIHSAANQTGEDAGLLLKIAGAESSYGKNTVNPNSSASGVFQIVGGTWDDIRDRLGAEISNPEDLDDQAVAAATYLKDLRRTIAPVTGNNPSDGDLYLTWFAGPSGGLNILTAIKNGEGGQKVTDYMTRKQIAANRSLLYDRLGRALTVNQFYKIMSDKVA